MQEIETVGAVGPIEVRPIMLRRTKDDITSSLLMARGVIVDSRDVLEMQDTVLDPKISKHGGRISLPFPVEHWSGTEEASVLYVPKFQNMRQGHLIQLHPLAASANAVARAIHEFGEGKRSEKSIVSIVKTYWRFAMHVVMGKTGIVNSAIFSTRACNSGRAVFLVNGTLSPHVVAVPRFMARKMGVKNGDLVIVGRDPTIWDGSIEIMSARVHDKNTIEANPLLCKQWGADCDGDELYIVKVPTGEKAQEEAHAQVGNFVIQNASWPSYLRESVQEETVDWGNLENEIRSRNVVTGKSVSPEDILNESEEVKTICARTGKDVSAECKKIALGLTPEEVEQYIQDQNSANLMMKIGLGPIGSLCMRIKTICGSDQDLLRSGAYISERLQQMLLDGKHTVGTNGAQYAPTDMIDLMNREGPFVATTMEDVLGVLKSSGLDTERARPFVAWVWLGYPAYCASMDLLDRGAGQEIKARILHRCRQMLRSEHLRSTLRKISIMDMKGLVKPEEISKSMMMFSVGVKLIYQSNHPWAMCAEQSATGPKMMELAMRLFHHNESDSPGVPRLLKNLAARKKRLKSLGESSSTIEMTEKTGAST